MNWTITWKFVDWKYQATKLVARVFCAIENNVIPVKTVVEVEEELKKDYEEKLRVVDRIIPDPFIPTLMGRGSWRNGILANAVISKHI